MHHVRSNSTRCKANRFLCFFFLSRVWMEIGVASGQTWPTFGQHKYIYIHILSALFVRNFPSPSSRRGDCCERRPHLPSLPPVCPWKYIHTKVHRCSLFILLHDACPSAISLVHVIHICSLLVRGLFRTNYKLGSGMQSDVGVGGPEGSVQIIKLDSEG